jgi:magnesium transporter
MVTYYFRTIKDSELKVLSEARMGVWVHVVAPKAEELESLIKQFGLDEDILEDAQDFFEVPRFERVGRVTYFFTRYPYKEEKEDSDTAPLLIVVGESFVLTIALREVPMFEKIIKGTLPVVTTQKTKLFIQLMTQIINSYDMELIRLRKAVHKDRGRLREIGMKGVERLVQFENKLNGIVEALMPTTQWLQHITKGNFLQLYTDDVSDMEDLVIDANQVVDSARSILKTLQNMRGGLEAIMTSRLNNSLSILTVLTILLTVPLVIASLYGMNVDLPLQDDSWTFILIIGINLVILVLLVVIFKKKQWF